MSVVNSYAPTAENVPVKLAISVDFPTLGNPTNPILATPVFATSNPTSPPPDDLGGSSNSRLYFASLALRSPYYALAMISKEKVWKVGTR